MPLINWTADLSVGFESIDTDHQVLIGLLNELDDAVSVGESRETVGRVLDSLLDYTDYHFGREEVLMRACRYPDMDAHIKTHDTLRAQVADIRSRYMRNPESIHAREVLAFLKNWLTAHILGRDKLYQPFLESDLEKAKDADRAYTDEMGRKYGEKTGSTGETV